MSFKHNDRLWGGERFPPSWPGAPNLLVGLIEAGFVRVAGGCVIALLLSVIRN